ARAVAPPPPPSSQTSAPAPVSQTIPKAAPSRPAAVEADAGPPDTAVAVSGAPSADEQPSISERIEIAAPRADAIAAIAIPRAAPPPALRTTYDPRVGQTPQRPGQPFPGRPGMRPGRPGFRRPGGPSLPRKPVHVSTLEMASHKKVVKIEEQVSLHQLASKMSLKATDVLLRLLSMGMSGVNINSTLDADTAKLLAGEFGWAVEDVAVDEGTALTQAL